MNGEGCDIPVEALRRVFIEQRQAYQKLSVRNNRKIIWAVPHVAPPAANLEAEIKSWFEQEQVVRSGTGR